MIEPLEVRCGHNTPAYRSGSRRGFGGLSLYRRDFVHAIIDNPAKRIILNILKITGKMPIRKTRGPGG
jgi:hypothetical protein